MKNKYFEQFKKTGKIDDYLKYTKEKRKNLEVSVELIDGTKRRDNCKNN